MSTAHLLTHLQNAEPTIPLPTLLAALSHHLSVDTPTPAPLAAAAISSPVFLAQPETHDRLQGLVGAFRHAVHLKHEALLKAEKESWGITRAIFSKSIQWGLRDWVQEALKGVQGGRAVLRLACSVGILLGTKGVKGVYIDVEKIEDEIIIALAEVMDAYAHHNRASDWEREFQSREYGTSFILLYDARIERSPSRDPIDAGSYLGIPVHTPPTRSEIKGVTPTLSCISIDIHNIFDLP